MRAILLLGVLLLSMTSVKAGQEKKILQVLHEQQNAWNAGDIKGYMKGYWQSDSLQFVSKSGITQGWSATFAMYQKSYPNKAKMGQLTFSKLQVHGLCKSSALVVGRWQLLREEDSPSGFFTLHFKKINGQWRIVLDHTS